LSGNHPYERMIYGQGCMDIPQTTKGAGSAPTHTKHSFLYCNEATNFCSLLRQPCSEVTMREGPSTSGFCEEGKFSVWFSFWIIWWGRKKKERKVLDLELPLGDLLPLFLEQSDSASVRKLWVDFHTGLLAFYGCKIFESPSVLPWQYVVELNFRVLSSGLPSFSGRDFPASSGGWADVHGSCAVFPPTSSNPDSFTTCVRPACFRISVLSPIVELQTQNRLGNIAKTS
jgi:hypothetical protein